MVHLMRLYKIAAFAFLLTLGTLSAARAEEKALAPFTLKSDYVLSWSGLPFGILHIEAEEGLDHYQITTDIRFTGLLKLFVKHESHTVVSGNPADFAKGPRVYESNYKTKNKPRRVKLAYDAQGTITEEILEPTENRQKRPAVPAADKNGVVDALSYTPELRRRLAAALAKGEKGFHFPVFDGRRLMMTDFTIQSTNPIRIIGTRKPLAGLTRDEMEKYNEGEPPLTIEFSPLPQLMPTRLHVDIAIGGLDATRVVKK